MRDILVNLRIFDHFVRWYRNKHPSAALDIVFNAWLDYRDADENLTALLYDPEEDEEDEL